MNTIDLFENIRNKPKIFFESTCLHELFLFYSAFYYTKSIHGILDDVDNFFHDKFTKWTINFYQLNELSHLNWKSSISIFYGDGEDGFIEFYNILDKFKSEYRL